MAALKPFLPWILGLSLAMFVGTLIALPIVILSIRGKPSDIGMLPEGDDSNTGHAVGPELGLADVIRNPGYWYIGLTLGLLFSVYTAILANIAPYATDLGTTAAQASTLIMTVAIMGLVGKLVFGMAADKVNLKVGLWTAMALVIAAFSVIGRSGHVGDVVIYIRCLSCERAAFGSTL